VRERRVAAAVPRPHLPSNDNKKTNIGAENTTGNLFRQKINLFSLLLSLVVIGGDECNGDSCMATHADFFFATGHCTPSPTAGGCKGINDFFQMPRFLAIKEKLFA
jgi:hypothetical protein